jgi:signal peptide peptidase-like protein 3
VVARKLHIGGVAKEVPRLSLPGKLVFPSIHNGRFSMLGLGDIVSYLMLMKLIAKFYNYKSNYVFILVSY